MTRRLRDALAALLLLGSGLVGLPAFLVTVHTQLGGLIPSLSDLPSALLSPGDGGLFLLTLLGIGWACWAVFVLAFLVELVTRIRGVRAPRLGPFVPQHSTAWAFTAVAVLLGSITPLAQTSVAAGAAASTAVGAEDVGTSPAAVSGTVSGVAGQREADKDRPWREYEVKKGDTLWDIADRKLDDPTAWPEIAEASDEIEQPHGRTLTDPDLILPGWTLHIPSTHTSTPDRQAPAPEAEREEAPSAPLDGPSEPADPSDDPAREQPSGAALPQTPLRPASPSADASQSAADGPTSAAGAPPATSSTPLAGASADGRVNENLSQADPAAEPRLVLPPTPLHPTAASAAATELTSVASAAGLPEWVRPPFARLDLDAAPTTRTAVLGVLAAQRSST